MFTLPRPLETLVLGGSLGALLIGSGLMGYGASGRHLQNLNPESLHAYQLHNSIRRNTLEPHTAQRSRDFSEYQSLLAQQPEIAQDITSLDWRNSLANMGLALTLLSVPFLLFGLYSHTQRVIRLENRLACMIHEYEGPEALVEALDDGKFDLSTHERPEKHPLRLLEKD